MCAPHCIAVVERRLSRRGLLGTGAAAGVAALALPRMAVAAEPRSFARVVDLTHPLGPDFPTFDGSPGIELETLVTFAEHGYNMYRWHLVEHTGVPPTGATLVVGGPTIAGATGGPTRILALV